MRTMLIIIIVSSRLCWWQISLNLAIPFFSIFSTKFAAVHSSPMPFPPSAPPCFDQSSAAAAAPFIWVGGPMLLQRGFFASESCPCPPKVGNFLVEFFDPSSVSADVDENFWSGLVSSIQMPTCSHFCVCDEAGECFEPANGSEPIVHAELYPFCDQGGCHLYFLFESGTLADCLLRGHRGTLMNSSAQFGGGKWGNPLPLGTQSPYLKARAAGCAGCQFILDHSAALKGQCLF